MTFAARSVKLVAPGSRSERAKDQIIRPNARLSRQAVDHSVHFCLVRDEHLAHDAQTARLPQQ